MGRKRDSVRTDLKLPLYHVIEEVASGRKANTALHNTLKTSGLQDEDRARLAVISYSTLRFWWAVSSDIGTNDPKRIADAALHLFARQKDRREVGKVPDLSEALLSASRARCPEEVPPDIAWSSVPEWLEDHLVNGLGKERALRFLQDSLLRPVSLTLRANSLLSTREKVMEGLRNEGINALGSELVPTAMTVPDGTRMDHLEAFRGGLVEVQDLSSQIACSLSLKGLSARHVVDACAGNGGKTLALGALMENKGVIVSIDPNERALLRLKQRAKRAQVWNYERLHLDDPSKLQKYRGWADMVLVDAPCSGLGTLRKNPDIKLHLKKEDIGRFSSVQSSLLKTYSELVRKGGRLVYCTCTIGAEEDQDVVQRFLREERGFKLEDAGSMEPALPRDMFQAEFFSTLPSDLGSGFFTAVMTRSKEM